MELNGKFGGEENGWKRNGETHTARFALLDTQHNQTASFSLFLAFVDFPSPKNSIIIEY